MPPSLVCAQTQGAFKISHQPAHGISFMHHQPQVSVHPRVEHERCSRGLASTIVARLVTFRVEDVSFCTVEFHELIPKAATPRDSPVRHRHKRTAVPWHGSTLSLASTRFITSTKGKEAARVSPTLVLPGAISAPKIPRPTSPVDSRVPPALARTNGKKRQQSRSRLVSPCPRIPLHSTERRGRRFLAPQSQNEHNNGSMSLPPPTNKILPERGTHMKRGQEKFSRGAGKSSTGEDSKKGIGK